MTLVYLCLIKIRECKSMKVSNLINLLLVLPILHPEQFMLHMLFLNCTNDILIVNVCLGLQGLESTILLDFYFPLYILRNRTFGVLEGPVLPFHSVPCTFKIN